MLNLVYMVEG